LRTSQLQLKSITHEMTSGAVAVPESIAEPRQRESTSSIARRLSPARFVVLLLIALGLVQTWGARMAMNPDGISYIEVGLNYAKGLWSVALNSYWSPLYSWILGLALRVFGRFSSSELPFVHSVNFCIYLATFLCFCLFLKQLIQYQHEREDLDSLATVPSWLWELLGYSLFLSSSLDLITINRVTPDLAVTAFVFLDAALLLRIRRGNSGWLVFAALGVVLGFGYLAKSILFVFDLAVMVVLFALGRIQRIPVSRLIVVPALFVMIAGPFIAAISLQKGRFTIGESSRLPYLFIVDHLPTGYLHPRPANLPFTFKHAPRLIHDHPAVYEFAGPVGGSIPAWYDTSYWYDGIRIPYSAKKQIYAFVKNAFDYSQILLVHQGPIVVGFLVLALCAGNARRLMKDISHFWFLFAPSVLILALYSGLTAETRYVGSFLAVTWMALFMSVRVPTSLESGRVTRNVVLASALALTLMISLQTIRNALQGPADIHDSAWKDRDVAIELQKRGIREGDNVGFIGSSLWAYWAHLDRIHIVAEIPEEDVDAFYQADAGTQESVRRAFARAGAKALVADRFPTSSDNMHWQPLGTTGYWISLLDLNVALNQRPNRSSALCCWRQA
jgi:hypothetical protein